MDVEKKLRPKRLAAAAAAALLLAVFLLILFKTNLILNHSCVGITYNGGSGHVYVDIILRCFESERDAKRYYRENSVSCYYIAAFNASESDRYANTREWFSNYSVPLIEEHTKAACLYAETNWYSCDALLKEFLEAEQLMLYGSVTGLKNAEFNAEIEDKISAPWHFLYMTGISEGYTDEERDFYLLMLSDIGPLCESIRLYNLAIEESDVFSVPYYFYEILSSAFEIETSGCPSVRRDGMDWREIAKSYNEDLNILRGQITDLHCGDEIPSATHLQTLGLQASLMKLGSSMREPPEIVGYYDSPASTDSIPPLTETDRFRVYLRSESQGSYVVAKEIFGAICPNQDFYDEYFFTGDECLNIFFVEASGDFRVVRESYSEGWVEVESLSGKAGDDYTYIGGDDPFNDE